MQLTLTLNDRKVLEYVYNANLKLAKHKRKKQKQLAEDLGWSPATLSRELKRGRVKQQSSQLEEYWTYSSVVAQENAESKWESKGPGLKLGKDHELADTIEKMLLGKKVQGMKALKYSPEAIVMHFDRVGWPTGKRLCARTIYNYVERTLVDRVSRDCILFKLGNQTQAAVVRRLNGLERSLGTKAFKEKFKTITVDNGSEFLNWKALEKSVFSKQIRTQIYYANAYSSWERGSSENLNGFIRYFIPKKTELRQIPEREIKKLEEFINEYPRKILGGCSAKNFKQLTA